MTKPNSNGPKIIIALVILLILLHQDVWFWNNKTVLFGFMPITLFWHACISLGASATWYLATKIAWPQELQEDTTTSSMGSE